MGKSKRRKTEAKGIPSFRNEREERAFWQTHDAVDYVDWDKAAVRRFPNLKPSTTTISLRLPLPLLADLKTLANKRDVPYQSLLKVYLAERITAEHARSVPPGSSSSRKGRRAGRRRVPVSGRPTHEQKR